MGVEFNPTGDSFGLDRMDFITRNFKPRSKSETGEVHTPSSFARGNRLWAAREYTDVGFVNKVEMRAFDSNGRIIDRIVFAI